LVWSRYQLPGHGCPEGGPGPEYVAYAFVFLGSAIICRYYKLKLSTKPKSFCNRELVFPN
jgi:hypothetical protein